MAIPAVWPSNFHQQRAYIAQLEIELAKIEGANGTYTYIGPTAPTMPDLLDAVNKQLTVSTFPVNAEVQWYNSKTNEIENIYTLTDLQGGSDPPGTLYTLVTKPSIVTTAVLWTTEATSSASITSDTLPTTYGDLFIIARQRSENNSTNLDSAFFRPDNNTSGVYFMQNLIATDAAIVASENNSATQANYLTTALQTSVLFWGYLLSYLHRYANSTDGVNKAGWILNYAVGATQSTQLRYMVYNVNNTAISTILFDGGTGNIEDYSRITIYGLK